MAILRRPEHFWPALWAVIAVALAAAILAEHYLGRVTVGEGPRAPAKVVEARLLPPFALAPETQSAPETAARPLFVPTRRPAPPAASVAASTMKRGQFVLTGVTVTPDLSVAFLKEYANGKTVSVKKGAQVNGLTIETVEPRRVILRQGDETEDLVLNVQVPARVAAAPAPAAATPNIFGVPPAPGATPGASGIPPAPGAAPAAGAPQPGTITPQGLPAAAGIPPAVPAAQPGQPAVPAAPPPSTGRRRPWINTQ